MKTPWEQAWDEATTEQRKTSRRWAAGIKHRSGLSGDRNQCPTCGDFFASTYAFDKHRYGKFGGNGKHRKCLTAVEMTEQGFARNEWYYWVSQKNPKHLILESIVMGA